MKNESRPRAILRHFAIVLTMLGCAYFAGSTLSGHSEDVNPIGQVAAQVGQTKAAQFDGVKLYHSAFEALRDYHKELADPAAQKSFVDEWEHKFDKTNDLKTEAGTDAAIAKMMESLGQRFDYFFGVEATNNEKDEVDATLVGIGATLSLKDQEAIFKGLPNEVTRADVENALKISKGHELTIIEPLEGGPSDGSLKAGDVITAVDGKPLDGILMKDAISQIKGKAGTTVDLTIDRTENGKTTTLTVKLTRAVVKVKVVHTKDLGNGITYVKLDNFMSRNATSEFREALTKAGKGKGLISTCAETRAAS